MPTVRSRLAVHAACAALAAALALGACSADSGKKKHASTGGAPDAWTLAKAAQTPVNELPAEFGTPVRQALADLGWEDGIYISRDGLALYCVYLRMDALSAVTAGVTPDLFYLYERGSDIGQDLSSPIAGATHPWIHGDVAYSLRASTADPFPAWSVSGLKFHYYNRGAPQGIQDGTDPALWQAFLFTEDSSGTTKIRFVLDTGRNPDGTGGILDLPSSVNEAPYSQDNPHAELTAPPDPSQLVLFYESPDKPGVGGHDIWYTTSSDGANTWSTPANVSSVNTAGDDIQPHLYFDGTSWWLYWTTANPADGKLGIFRALQGTPGDWDSWGTPELVVSAGTANAVGEPSLTSNGDLSFVVVTENPDGTPYDRYDADPWFLPHR